MAKSTTGRPLPADNPVVEDDVDTPCPTWRDTSRSILNNTNEKYDAYHSCTPYIPNDLQVTYAYPLMLVGQ